MPFEFDFNPFAGFVGMLQDPRNRWFSLYLVTSLVVAWAVYLVQAGRDPETRARGFIAFVFPGEIYWHPSARVDYWFYLLNRLLFAAIFAGMGLVATGASRLVLTGLGHVVQEPLWGGHPLIATLASTLFYVLAFDFGLWLAHYLFHRLPVFWEFHKVHHSAEVLTPISAGRVHPIDDLVSYAFGGLFGGSMAGLCNVAFGDDAVMLAVFQLHIVFFVFYAFGFHLRHSHVWLPYTGWLGHLFISPAHHQVHHSSEERHWDRNMGFIFALWDWMFGTLHVPSAQREDFALGIGGEEKEFNSVWRLYALPFRNIVRRLRHEPCAEASIAVQLGFVDVGEPLDRRQEPEPSVPSASR